MVKSIFETYSLEVLWRYAKGNFGIGQEYMQAKAIAELERRGISKEEMRKKGVPVDDCFGSFKRSKLKEKI